MNIENDNDLIKNGAQNVLSFFTNKSQIEAIVPFNQEDLINEDELNEVLVGPELKVNQKRKIVSENQFPDQSIYILSEQIMELRTKLKRIKFYLDDFDDVIPR